jgi:hypothetical protein
MIPALIVVGLVIGRWWIIPPVALLWSIALALTGVLSGTQDLVAAALLGALNVAVGVLVHKGIAGSFARLRDDRAR